MYVLLGRFSPRYRRFATRAAGVNRLSEWGQQQGIAKALGLSNEEWVNRRLKGQIRFSVEERRVAVRPLTAPVDDGGEGLSQRAAAAVLGVSHVTIARDTSAGTFVPDEADTSEGGDGDAGTFVPPERYVDPDTGELFDAEPKHRRAGHRP